MSPDGPVTHESSPHGLPVRHEPFFGRREELESFPFWLDMHRLVTIIGEPGIGKSSLATVAAGSVLDRFPGGVHRVAVRSGIAEDGLLSDISGAVLAEPLADARVERFLVERFSVHRSLLLLDQGDRSLKAVRTVASWLRDNCPTLGVVTTGREPLGLADEEVVRLGPLEVPEIRDGISPAELLASPSVRLFADRVEQLSGRSPFPERDLLLAAEICRRLDGVPAAIRVMASTAALQGVDVIHSALLLAERQDAPLYKAIDSALDALDLELANKALGLSVFCGDWTASAAAAVVGAEDRVSVQAALNRLIEAGLLDLVVSSSGSFRHRLPDSVVALFSARIPDSERLQAEAAHMRHFRGVAAQFESLMAGSDVRGGMDLMNEEYPNVLLAAERAIAQRSPDVFGFTVALVLFGQRARPPSESRAIAFAACEMVDAAEASTEVARTLNTASAIHIVESSFDEAERLSRRAYDISLRVGDILGMAMSRSNLAVICKSMSRYEEAKDFGSDSVDLMRQTGDRRRLLAAMTNLGSILEDLAEYGSAEVIFGECLDVAESIGDEWTAMRAQSNVAEMRLHQGDARAAGRSFLDCLTRATKLDDGTTIALSLEGLSFSSLKLGRLRESAILLAIAERVRESAELPTPPIQEGFVEEARGQIESQLGYEALQQSFRTAEEFEVEDVPNLMSFLST